MQQHGNNYFAYRPPGAQVGSKGKKHDNDAYQIKGNHKCSYMVANVLPTTTHSRDQRVKIIFFRTMSYCISNLKKITNAAKL